jgi:pimeloyl-ACP methyl ester carboxylesterase
VTKSKSIKTAQSFKIQIPQAVLDDLSERLARTRWTDEVNGADWDYGSNLTYMTALINYWQSEFDWRKQEEALNKFAHFRAQVDDFGLHFIHARGKGENPLPLLLTHGFPDSFLRFLKIIPMLIDPESYGGKREDAFDVVVPSLPGYGFSDRPAERGFSGNHVATLFAKLMTDELGYNRFGAHGGDWGSSITEQLAFKYPDSLIGIHLTEIPYWHLFAQPSADLSETEQKYLEAGQAWAMAEGGYASIQSTKPQTLAYGLNDSPAGLAAWIVEKFHSWSDDAGDVERRFTKDELLTNITIYWATETINSAARYYYEAQHMPREDAGTYIEVPTGVAIFPKDLVPAPREYAARFFNVQRWTEMPRGGHFTAMEEPELLAEDIRAFFRPLRRSADK